MFEKFNLLAADWDLGINVTVTGLVIVFSMLILLVFVLFIFGKIFGIKKPVANKPVPQPVVKQQSVPVVPAVSNSDDNEIIAVIAAAVATMYEGSDVKPVIRKIQKSSKNVRPAWTQAGIFENTRAF